MAASPSRSASATSPSRLAPSQNQASWAAGQRKRFAKGSRPEAPLFRGVLQRRLRPGEDDEDNHSGDSQCHEGNSACSTVDTSLSAAAGKAAGHLRLLRAHSASGGRELPPRSPGGEAASTPATPGAASSGGSSPNARAFAPWVESLHGRGEELRLSGRASSKASSGALRRRDEMSGSASQPCLSRPPSYAAKRAMDEKRLSEVPDHWRPTSCTASSVGTPKAAGVPRSKDDSPTRRTKALVAPSSSGAGVPSEQQQQQRFQDDGLLASVSSFLETGAEQCLPGSNYGQVTQEPPKSLLVSQSAFYETGAELCLPGSSYGLESQVPPASPSSVSQPSLSGAAGVPSSYTQRRFNDDGVLVTGAGFSETASVTLLPGSRYGEGAQPSPPPTTSRSEAPFATLSPRLLATAAKLDPHGWSMPKDGGHHSIASGLQSPLSPGSSCIDVAAGNTRACWRDNSSPPRSDRGVRTHSEYAGGGRSALVGGVVQQVPASGWGTSVGSSSGGRHDRQSQPDRGWATHSWASVAGQPSELSHYNRLPHCQQGHKLLAEDVQRSPIVNNLNQTLQADHNNILTWDVPSSGSQSQRRSRAPSTDSDRWNLLTWDANPGPNKLPERKENGSSSSYRSWSTDAMAAAGRYARSPGGLPQDRGLQCFSQQQARSRANSQDSTISHESLRGDSKFEPLADNGGLWGSTRKAKVGLPGPSDRRERIAVQQQPELRPFSSRLPRSMSAPPPQSPWNPVTNEVRPESVASSPRPGVAGLSSRMINTMASPRTAIFNGYGRARPSSSTPSRTPRGDGAAEDTQSSLDSARQRKHRDLHGSEAGALIRNAGYYQALAEMLERKVEDAQYAERCRASSAAQRETARVVHEVKQKVRPQISSVAATLRWP